MFPSANIIEYNYILLVEILFNESFLDLLMQLYLLEEITSLIYFVLREEAFKEDRKEQEIQTQIYSGQ